MLSLRHKHKKAVNELQQLLHSQTSPEVTQRLVDALEVAYEHVLQNLKNKSTFIRMYYILLHYKVPRHPHTTLYLNTSNILSMTNCGILK